MLSNGQGRSRFHKTSAGWKWSWMSGDRTSFLLLRKAPASEIVAVAGPVLNKPHWIA
jgi:hypothetical protein